MLYLEVDFLGASRACVRTSCASKSEALRCCPVCSSLVVGAWESANQHLGALLGAFFVISRSLKPQVSDVTPNSSKSTLNDM